MMNDFKKNVYDAVKVTAIAAVLTLGINLLYAWTGPTAEPPDGNVAAPLNVGATAQTKIGNLNIGDTAHPATLRIQNGNQGKGKVLSAADDAGTVGWTDAHFTNSFDYSTLGGAGNQKDWNFVAPPGVTAIRVVLTGSGGHGGDGDTSPFKGGGGGGGGAYIDAVISTTPGDLYTIHIGTWGEVTTFSSHPSNSGVHLIANNGSNGGDSNGSPGSGGSGGTAQVSGSRVLRYTAVNGQSGNAGTTSSGGAGGNSAINAGWGKVGTTPPATGGGGAGQPCISLPINCFQGGWGSATVYW